jgi:diguanylate cyclase (GGDEF)-like protein/PAS domain S-box-containing protein
LTADSRLLVFGASDAEARSFFGEVLGLVPVESGGWWQVFASPSAAERPAGDARARLCLTCTNIGSAVDELQASSAGVLATIHTADHGRLVDARPAGGGHISFFEPNERSARRGPAVAAAADYTPQARDVDGTEVSPELTPVAPVPDLTERGRRLSAAERSDLLWHGAQDAMLVVRRRDGSILEANRATETTYGYSREQLLTRTVFDFQAEADHALVEQQMEDAARGGALFQAVHLRADGSTFPVEVSSRGKVGPSEEVLLINVVRDITHRRRVDDVLKQVMAEREVLAMTDPLTDVANLRAFGDMAQVELERSRRYSHPLSLVFLDIDDFKRVNDEWGHTEGDRVLRSFASVLAGSVRTVDGVARLGGDEFVVMMPETGPDEALALAHRLLRALASVEAGAGRIACSIGVATFIAAPDSVDRMIDEADRLLRAAKSAGKNAVRSSIIDLSAGEHGSTSS